MLSSDQIREKYLKFFESKGHIRIPSAPLIPENDPTVLFTTAGMHPLVPFLLGQPHPAGKKLVNFQKCIRTDDIDEVGDNSHNTFFEMLGNWSLGDYFKKDSIAMSFEFLTKELQLDPKNLAVTCFAGDNDAQKDDISAETWKNQGIPESRLSFLGKKDNWWGPAGQTGPCGPDTEIFYWTDLENPAPVVFDPKDNRWVEIWNNVFMEYFKNSEGKFETLKQQNVDTGMGFERIVMVMQNQKSIFDTDIFADIMQNIQTKSRLTDTKSQRIIADHLRTAVFLLSEKIIPSNVEQGYILRRLIRRAVRYMKKIEVTDIQGLLGDLTTSITRKYINTYPENFSNNSNPNIEKFIYDELIAEYQKFEKTLLVGLKEFEKYANQLKNNNQIELSGRLAFKLYDTYGFPIEMTTELANENNIAVDRAGFDNAFAKHQELSRQGSEQKFKGGLADHSETTTAYHTITHLLHAALRKILGTHVEQRGSNITPDRLRFDFSHPDKLTPDQIQAVEKWVNDAITSDLVVIKEEMPIQDALSQGAIGIFKDKYGDKVSVYTIKNKTTGEIYSREICGGPHIENAANLGTFKILKEESSSAGIRRIKAVLQ